MNWWVTIKVLGIVWSSFGPYDSLAECNMRKDEMYKEGMTRHNAGEQVYFLGKQVTPNNTKLSCVQK